MESSLGNEIPDDWLQSHSSPTKDEIVNYSVVVFVTIVVLTALIAGLDYLTGEGVLRLFDVN